MSLPLQADQVVTALRAWISEEIKQAPSFGHDLGKHYFTTATATIGVIATVAKLGKEVTVISTGLALAVVMLFAAAVIGMLLSIPFPRLLDGSTDLFAEYNLAVTRIVRYSVTWLVLWVVGTAWALVEVL